MSKLPRILEPEVMDTVEDAADYDSMDHSAVNRAFAADFLKVWNGKSPILDVGTGTALIPIEICTQSAAGQILAVDLSEEMLKRAEANVVRAGFADRITLQRVDGKDIPFPWDSFGAVVSNSIIHHIPEPAVAYAEIVGVAKADATIFVRDLLRPNTLAELDALVDTYASGATPRQRQLFSDSLHAALTVDEVREIVGALGYDPASVQQTSDRHWTWCVKP